VLKHNQLKIIDDKNVLLKQLEGLPFFLKKKKKKSIERGRGIRTKVTNNPTLLSAGRDFRPTCLEQQAIASTEGEGGGSPRLSFTP